MNTGSWRGARLACQYGRYGYRRVHALLRAEGWQVSHSRVLRIWRLEGLKVPPKQPKRIRLWLADGSCIRLAPTHRNHVWSWDFVFDRTRDGRVLKLMVVIDEFTRRCLAIHVARRIRSKEALEVFAELMVEHGVPEHIRSDNGPEMVAADLHEARRHALLKFLRRCRHLEPRSAVGVIVTLQHQVDLVHDPQQAFETGHQADAGDAGLGPVGLVRFIHDTEAALEFLHILVAAVVHVSPQARHDLGLDHAETAAEFAAGAQRTDRVFQVVKQTEHQHQVEGARGLRIDFVHVALAKGQLVEAMYGVAADGHAREILEKVRGL